jgi:hypothetical protein
MALEAPSHAEVRSLHAEQRKRPGILLFPALLWRGRTIVTRTSYIAGGALGALRVALAIFACAVDVAVGPGGADALAPTARALYVAGCAGQAIDLAAACLTSNKCALAVLLALHIAGAAFAVLLAGLA